MQTTPQHQDVGAPNGAPRLAIGTAVCVWNQFLGRWSGGFVVAGVVGHGYLLRRQSDGHVFEDTFAALEVMEERRNPNSHFEDSHVVDRRAPVVDDTSA